MQLPVQCPTERLPFEVSIARPEDLDRVALVRAQAYGHHLPEFGGRLATPEPADHEAGNVVLAAMSRADRRVLGSMRIHTNVLRPLPLEASKALPGGYKHLRLCEATRLCVMRDPGSALVRNALFKAFFLFCRQQAIEAIVIAGRSPIDRLYERLLFTDVLEPGAFFRVAHMANLPHRVMTMRPLQAERIWREQAHPLFDFAFRTQHPDIAVEMRPIFDLLAL